MTSFILSATVGVTKEEGYISRMGNIMGTAQGLGVFMGRAGGGVGGGGGISRVKVQAKTRHLKRYKL